MTPRIIAALRELADAYEAATGTAALAPTTFAPQPARPAAVAGSLCPFHNKELRPGKYGLFCSGQGGSGPLNAKGYCEWPNRTAA